MSHEHEKTRHWSGAPRRKTQIFRLS
jgi:hypothetical protein